MTSIKAPQKLKSKNLNNSKTRNTRNQKIIPIVNNYKIQLSGNDKQLIAKYLEDNKHLANPKTKHRTKAITTDKIIQEALGRNLEDNMGNLPGAVSQYVKSLDGWSNQRKRVNKSNPVRIWIFNPDSNGGGTIAIKPDSNSLQKLCHPLKKETKSPDIFSATEPEDKLICRENTKTIEVSCDDEENIKDVDWMPSNDSEAVSESTELYKADLVQKTPELSLNQGIKEVQNRLMQIWLMTSKEKLSIAEAKYRKLEKEFDLEIVEKACETLPPNTLCQLLKLIPGIGELLRSKNQRG